VRKAANPFTDPVQIGGAPFVASFLHHAPIDRMTTIRHKQLMNNSAQAVELIMNAISVSGPGA
jgi:hypothetical protein